MGKGNSRFARLASSFSCSRGTKAPAAAGTWRIARRCARVRRKERRIRDRIPPGAHAGNPRKGRPFPALHLHSLRSSFRKNTAAASATKRISPRRSSGSCELPSPPPFASALCSQIPQICAPVHESVPLVAAGWLLPGLAPLPRRWPLLPPE